MKNGRDKNYIVGRDIDTSSLVKGIHSAALGLYVKLRSLNHTHETARDTTITALENTIAKFSSLNDVVGE